MGSQRDGIRVGTSGYSYGWNEGKPSPFEWYLKVGFNTVEVNASFYRFPVPSWTKTWMKAPRGFDFSIKVHRSVTHYRRLGEGSVELLDRFREPLRPLEDRIAFWLFQMPPSFLWSEGNERKVTRYLRAAQLGARAAFEFRHPSWWDHVGIVQDAGAAFCSVDAPKLPRQLVVANDVLYLRIHGRQVWYSYRYTDVELEDIASRILASGARRRYVYLNNDEGMLPNGGFLRERLGLG